MVVVQRNQPLVVRSMNINPKGDSVVTGVFTCLPVAPTKMRSFKKPFHRAVGDDASLAVTREHGVAKRPLAQSLLDLSHFECRAIGCRAYRVLVGYGVDLGGVHVRVNNGAWLFQDLFQPPLSRLPEIEIDHVETLRVPDYERKLSAIFFNRSEVIAQPDFVVPFDKVQGEPDARCNACRLSRPKPVEHLTGMARPRSIVLF